jgi:hypothetical protein
MVENVIENLHTRQHSLIRGYRHYQCSTKGKNLAVIKCCNIIPTHIETSIKQTENNYNSNVKFGFM